MAIKWKNTRWDAIWASCLKIFRKEEKWLILGLSGCLWGFSLLQKLGHYQARSFPALALKINFALAIGGVSLVKYGMKRRNKHWDLESGHFFEEWKRRQRNLTILLLSAWVLLGILSLAFFYSIRIKTETFATVSMNYMYFKNYSIGYIMAGTLVLQWFLCRMAGGYELKKCLSLFMANEAQINQKNLESAIRSEKMKVDLISNVSHDLKTPLTSMVGYIELMKKEPLGDVAKDYVEIISNRAQKLKEMVDSLFDLAKTSSGNVELKFEEMEMNCLIEQVMADMAEQISRSGRETVVSLTAEHTEFLSDSIYMYRIVQNLIENALKYSQENTRIFLKTSIVDWQKLGEFQAHESRKVRFEITNTASYRMDFTKDQIVERFARGEESRTTEGNGLGLAIVNTYTAALGGRFDVSIDCDQFKAMVEF